MIPLSISIFLKDFLSISIFFRIALSISISISIFSTSPYRYRYFSKVSIYRQSIFHIDILTRRRSNKNVFYRCTRGRSNKMCFTGAKKCLFYHFLDKFHGMSFYTVHYNIHKCGKDHLLLLDCLAQLDVGRADFWTTRLIWIVWANLGHFGPLLAQKSGFPT